MFWKTDASALIQGGILIIRERERALCLHCLPVEFPPPLWKLGVAKNKFMFMFIIVSIFHIHGHYGGPESLGKAQMTISPDLLWRSSNISTSRLCEWLAIHEGRRCCVLRPSFIDRIGSGDQKNQDNKSCRSFWGRGCANGVVRKSSCDFQ